LLIAATKQAAVPLFSYSMRKPEMTRAITGCWICSVPSKMSKIFGTTLGFGKHLKGYSEADASRCTADAETMAMDDA